MSHDYKQKITSINSNSGQVQDHVQTLKTDNKSLLKTWQNIINKKNHI
jgi:hypothetical protein